MRAYEHAIRFLQQAQKHIDKLPMIESDKQELQLVIIAIKTLLDKNRKIGCICQPNKPRRLNRQLRK